MMRIFKKPGFLIGLNTSLFLLVLQSSLYAQSNIPTSTNSSTNQPLIPQTFNDNNNLPPSSTQNIPSDDQSLQQFNRYHLDIGDAITVNVSRFPEFNFTALIDPEGYVLIPVVGKMSFVGLTLDEVQEKIAYELQRRFLKDKPEVTAVLAQPRPVQITVLGEVLKPGFYTIGPSTSLNEVISLIGGTNKQADLRAVVVRRRLFDGTVLEHKFDLFTPLQNGTIPPRVRLQGGDTVIVSRLEVGADEDYDRLLVARSNLATPQITIRVLSYAAGGIGAVTVPNGSSFLDVLGSIAPNPDNANLGDITLMRFDPERGGIVTQELDAQRAIKGDIAMNVPLQDQDVIIVGRSLLGKAVFALSVLSEPIKTFSSFRAFVDSIPAILQ